MTLLLMLALVQTWTPGRELPNPRFAPACAAFEDRVYLMGGAVGTLQRPVPTATVDAYDAAADTWITGLAPLPEPRAFAAGALLDGRLYVIGGSDGRRASARVDRYDPVADRWETVTPLPEPAEAAAAATLDGRLYVVGGFSGCCRGNYRRTVFRFVPDGAGRWEIADSLVVPRTSLAAAATGNRLYAVGGRYYNDLATAEYLTGRGWVLEPEAMAEPRSGHAAAGYGEFIAVAGGMGRSGLLNSVEVLNVGTGQWTTVEPMTHGRAYGGMALAAGRLVVLGGAGRSGLLPAVEMHEPFYPPAVAEDRPGPVPRDRQSRVARGPLRLESGPYELRDVTGTLIAHGQGPATITPVPGVYFLLRSGDAVSTRLTIIR